MSRSMIASAILTILLAVGVQCASIANTGPSASGKTLTLVPTAHVGFIRGDYDPENSGCTEFDPTGIVPFDYGKRSLVIDLGRRLWTSMIVLSSTDPKDTTPQLEKKTLCIYTSNNNVVYTPYSKPFRFKLTRSDQPGEVWRLELSGLEISTRYIKLKQYYDKADYGFGIANLKSGVEVYTDRDTNARVQSSSHKEADTILLGTAGCVITPPIGTPLIATDDLVLSADNLLDDLEARVLWFQKGPSPADAVCIISIDLECVGDPFTSDILNALHAKYGISRDRVLISASHTHSSPAVSDVDAIGAGKIVPQVAAMIKDRILKAVDSAATNLRPVTVHVGRGMASEKLAINRRLKVHGEVLLMANPKGIDDQEIMVIACRDASTDEPCAVLFQYTCHASTMSYCGVSADWPGAVRRFVEASLGNGAVAALLPGCAGDVRSNVTLAGGVRFRDGTPDDMTHYGEALGKDILHIVESSTKQVEPQLFGRSIKVELPLADYPSKAQLEEMSRSDDAMTKVMAERVLSKPYSNMRPFKIHRVDLARDVSLLAMDAEVCVAYDLYTKGLHPDRFVVPMGFTGGLMAYIPTAKMIPEGGYEVEASLIYFYLPSHFSPELEEIIHKGIRSLLD